MQVIVRDEMMVDDNPRNSSRTCPICGRTEDPRMGASLNLLQTAISKRMAEGLRFNPGAFQNDAMMILYEPAMDARSEPNGTSSFVGVTWRSPPDNATEPHDVDYHGNLHLEMLLHAVNI
jgi:hypothetical protein